MTVLWFIAGILFTAAALCVLGRLIAGPTLIDRLIASDVLLTTLVLVVGTEMVVNGHTRTIPLMVVLVATAILSSIAVARFASRTTAQSAGAAATEDDDAHL